MVISRSPDAAKTMEGNIKFGDQILKLDDSISILGVTFDRKLNFEHIKEITHKASLRVTILRRMKHLLDARGLRVLYRAQVRPFLEYGTLTWMSSPRTYMNMLNKVQQRAEQLITSAYYREGEHVITEDSLGHRRDVATLCVMHKVQIQRVPHLQGLRIPTRRSQQSTRTMLSSECLVEVPWSNSSQHQRTYVSRAARLWNSFTSTVDAQSLTMQQAKVAAHTWRRQHPDSSQ